MTTLTAIGKALTAAVVLGAWAVIIALILITAFTGDTL